MSQQNRFLITVTMTKKLVHVALYSIVISGRFPFGKCNTVLAEQKEACNSLRHVGVDYIMYL